MSAYLILTLSPKLGMRGEQLLSATEVAIYSEPWPTSVHGEVRIVLAEVEGPYHIALQLLKSKVDIIVPHALKPLYRDHEAEMASRKSRGR